MLSIYIWKLQKNVLMSTKKKQVLIYLTIEHLYNLFRCVYIRIYDKIIFYKNAIMLHNCMYLIIISRACLFWKILFFNKKYIDIHSVASCMYGNIRQKFYNGNYKIISCIYDAKLCRCSLNCFNIFSQM